jgi:hypothetical protein
MSYEITGSSFDIYRMYFMLLSIIAGALYFTLGAIEGEEAL